MSYRPVLLALLLAPATATPQDDFTAADAAVRARAVLKKHCLACHGDKDARSTLRVLDHKQMTAAAGESRPIAFVSAASPTASQALDLIKEGSMPPGALPKVSTAEVEALEKWVREGAARYPVRFDDEFAHEAILADVEGLKGQAKTARYLSLHHIAEPMPDDLAAARGDFLKGARTLFTARTQFHPVDPTATIFRIDLGQAGWLSDPFLKLTAQHNPAGRTGYNPYDLVLLEYPHAVIPADSPTFDRLAATYLDPQKPNAADLVRPIPFVRGDWFVDTVTFAPPKKDDPSLKNDLYRLLKGRPPIPPGLAPQAVAKPITRKIEPTPVAPGAVRLPALDAWYAPGDPPDPGEVKGFTVATIDAVTKRPRDVFHEDDTFFLRISAAAPAHVESVYVDIKGKVEDQTELKPLPSGGVLENKEPLPGGGFAAMFGTEYLRTFAAPAPFPPGVLWRAKLDQGEIERVVHPFFRVASKGDKGVVDLSAARIARKTATIRIVEKQ